MRTVSNSALAALVLVALFWGNCFSCPQMLLVAAQKKAHDCCKRGPKAPSPAQLKCQSAPMRNFVPPGAPQVHADLAVVAAVLPPLAAPVTVALPFLPQAPEPSPPDLEILNSSIRI